MYALPLFDRSQGLRRELPGAVLEFFPQFLSPDEVRAAFDALMAPGALAWRQERVRMYGRDVQVPRLTAWYGEAHDYAYSGIAMSSLPWTPQLQELRARVEQVSDHRFSNVLLNLYRDGNDSVAWHSDDERELGPRPVIASLSLGAARDFHLRRRDYRRSRIPVERYSLGPGSLLIMRGDTQRYWEHQVPKRRGAAAPGPRINLTFRRLAERTDDPA